MDKKIEEINNILGLSLRDSTEVLVRAIMGDFCANIVNVFLSNRSEKERVKELQKIFDENMNRANELQSRFEK